MREQRPCFECEERFVGCQIECDVLKAWNEQEKARKEKYNEARRRENILMDYSVDAAYKNQKKRRRRGRK